MKLIIIKYKFRTQNEFEQMNRMNHFDMARWWYSYYSI